MTKTRDLSTTIRRDFDEAISDLLYVYRQPALGAPERAELVETLLEMVRCHRILTSDELASLRERQPLTSATEADFHEAVMSVTAFATGNYLVRDQDVLRRARRETSAEDLIVWGRAIRYLCIHYKHCALWATRQRLREHIETVGLKRTTLQRYGSPSDLLKRWRDLKAKGWNLTEFGRLLSWNRLDGQRAKHFANQQLVKARKRLSHP